ncbi:hypothetical protein [Hymenobacter ruricola]|uniref:Uncharacterized protein n=1 Tax=Hymenobacter ruricola TaxID=2791023 RepID=A0ABS0I2Y8_9BACT|nr:hypothetical protein [Hymenobacter ruricola]MBF9221321.1 hypothetical protein [Hymenobacter ruricola]
MVVPLLLGLLLVIEAALQAIVGYWHRATVPGGLLGLGLLVLAVRGAFRSNRPMLLTSRREGFLLEPTGRSLTQSLPSETIPLASIKAYKYWSRLLKYTHFLQYHLRLELADGRVVHLADRPGLHPDASTGAVRLDAVARKLARWAKPGTQRRQLFYLTRTARVLLWLSWTAIATALLLLGLGHPAGSLLLFPAAGYWASYYLGRGSAELTA